MSRVYWGDQPHQNESLQQRQHCPPESHIDTFVSGSPPRPRVGGLVQLGRCNPFHALDALWIQAAISDSATSMLAL